MPDFDGLKENNAKSGVWGKIIDMELSLLASPGENASAIGGLRD
jgi:hypothetical protein